MLCLLEVAMANKKQINVFCQRAGRYELCSPSHSYCVSHYFNMAGSELFVCIQNSSHCLPRILPIEKQTGLRPRGHSYVLFMCQYNLCKSSFPRRLIKREVFEETKKRAIDTR